MNNFYLLNKIENDLLHPDCKPIPIPSGDLFYSQFNATCMEFVRSSPAPRRDCTLGVVAQKMEILDNTPEG